MKQKITTKIIADKVIKITGCDIRQTRRTPNAVVSRVIYTRLCAKLINTNLTNIGKEINKHHATVIHYQRLYDNPNYFKIDRQTEYLNILDELINEYDLKTVKEPQENQNTINRIIEKDKSYTKLLMKYNQLKIEIEDVKKDNQKLVERNFKLTLEQKEQYNKTELNYE